MRIPTRASRHRRPGTPRDQLELQRFVSGIDVVAFGIHASRACKEGSASIAGADGRDFDGLLLDVVDQRLFLALAGTRIASMNAASAGDTWRRPG